MTHHCLGWDSCFAHAFEALSDPTLRPGRIVGVYKNSFMVDDGTRDYRVMLSGKFYNPASGPSLFPAAGDWVAIREQTVAAVLPRKNALARGASGRRDKRETHAVAGQVIAANLDWVFIVCGLDRDFNLRRIERYLTLVYNSGCSPVIVLNKADLHEKACLFAIQVEEIAVGVPVHLVAAKTGMGDWTV